MAAPYVKEWLHDEQILCYRFYEMSGAAMDDWLDDVSGINRLWPAQRPLHTLIDLRAERVIISAQVLLHAGRAAAMRPRPRGRTAVLIANPTVAQVVSGLLPTALPLGIRQGQLFSDETLAMEWLLEALRR